MNTLDNYSIQVNGQKVILLPEECTDLLVDYVVDLAYGWDVYSEQVARNYALKLKQVHPNAIIEIVREYTDEMVADNIRPEPINVNIEFGLNDEQSDDYIPF